jgi:hypothetical protein
MYSSFILQLHNFNVIVYFALCHSFREMSNRPLDKHLKAGRIGRGLILVAAAIQTTGFIARWSEGKQTTIEAVAVANAYMLSWWAWQGSKHNEKMVREMIENGGVVDIEKGTVGKGVEKEKVDLGGTTEKGKEGSEVTTADTEKEALKEETVEEEKARLEM